MSRWRRLVRWIGVLGVVIAATAAAGFPVYVHPQIDPLHKSDAVLVLGGYEYDRYPQGMGLAAAGWAPNLVISNPNGPRDAWLYEYCRTPHPEFTLHCFEPEPSTTSGEAKQFAALAAEHGWRSVIVVTFRPQISRARFILQRCFTGKVIMVESRTPVPVQRWPFEYAYQTAGYVRAILNPAC